MKLHADLPESTSITAYGEGWIQLPDARYTHSIILSTEGLVQAWDCESFAHLSEQNLANLAQAAQGAQVVLLGSGRRTQFPPPAWLRPFAQQQLGLESMDTAAACRTFNVLAGEGRKVVAALILQP